MLELSPPATTAEAPAATEFLGLVDAACVRTEGEFDKLSQTASRRGWMRLSETEAAALSTDFRPPSRRQAFLAKDGRVLLAELSGGVQRAVSPVQERGKPTSFWNYDFPRIRLCRVIGAAGAPDWWRGVGKLRLGGPELGDPVLEMKTARGLERTWAAPGFTHVRAVSTADGSQVEFTISRQPDEEARRSRSPVTSNPR